jgi:hypothetical protein
MMKVMSRMKLSTPAGVGEHLDHFDGLGGDRPGGHGIAQTGRRSQERHRMPGGRGVEDDEIRGPGGLELLHPAEHQQVADTGSCGGDDVECPGGHKPSGDALQTVIGEIVEQCLVGGEEAPIDLAPLGGAGGQYGAGGGDLGAVEEARKRAPRGEADDQHRQSGPGRGFGEGRAYRGLAHPALTGDDEHP